MRDRVIEDFAPSLGQPFTLSSADGPRQTLTLDKVEALPRSVRDSGAFRLEFLGPADPVLPQAIYSLERDGEAIDVFIVPIERDSRGTRYEAIFN